MSTFNFSGFNFDGIAAPKPGSPSKMAGSDGVAAPGGYLYSGERNPRLAGDQKHITFANLIRGTLVVAAAYRAYNTLGRSAKWSAEPNKLGGRKAEKMADILVDGLFEAPMPRPWTSVVGKALVGAAFHGYSMHEWQGKRMEIPGRPWWFTNLEHRPQYTIAQWIKPDEREPWTGVVQRTKSGGQYVIARSRLLYVVDDSITDSPDGAGFLQHLVEHADHLRAFEKNEGIGIQSNLAGMPILRAPLAKLRAAACAAMQFDVNSLTPEQSSKVDAWVRTSISFATEFMENHVATPDRGLTLDSEVYLGTDPTGKITPSSVYLWALEIAKSQGLSLEEVASAINRIGREMARVMGTEWMLMGDGEGARAVHTDKTDMFILNINSWLSQIGFYATAQLAYPMTELNGFDPQTCTPRCRPQPIPLETLESICNALKAMAAAGQPIPPRWEGTNILLARGDLPPFPEQDIEEDAMLPRGKADPTKTPNEPGDPKPADDREDDDEANNNNPGAGATS